MNTYTLPNDLPLDKKTLNSGIVFYHYTSLKDSFKEKSHLNCNAFSLVISGTKTMHFAEKTVHIQDTEIHLLSSGNCIASVSISGQKTFESILIFFTNETLSDFYSAHYSLAGTIKKKKSNPYLEFEKDSFINNYIQSLLFTLRKNKQFSEPMKKIKLNELLLYLLETYPDNFLSFKQATGISDEELRVRHVVEANKNNNLTADELSFLCNMSLSTFKRQFRKIYNTTPGAWLNKHRMILASAMLRQKKEKPGEIWHKLGFETHTGFTKSFKKYYGCTPKAFLTI
jgi:AraC family transcriptional regulator, exoenzyme S synthesis regulatory protein ExsA